jgi:hypothetical protein
VWCSPQVPYSRVCQFPNCHNDGIKRSQSLSSLSKTGPPQSGFDTLLFETTPSPMPTSSTSENAHPPSTAPPMGSTQSSGKETDPPVSIPAQYVIPDSLQQLYRAHLSLSPASQTRPPRPLPSPGRPVSMPPQAFGGTTHLAAAGAGPSTVTGSSSDKERPADDTLHAKRRDGNTKGRSSHKILGDYTLSKTLGAGSMGKVKLAVHNVTGEKVGVVVGIIKKIVFSIKKRHSLLSKSFLGSIPHHLLIRTVPIRKLCRSKLQKMPRRKFALLEKRRFRCSSITLTYVVCAR